MTLGGLLLTLEGLNHGRNGFRPCFIEPGNDQDKSLGNPLCILRERGEDDRRAFARIRQVVAKALAEAKGKTVQRTPEQRQNNAG
jgi:hypothetical protein